MTLQELIEQLQALPESAKQAQVSIIVDEDEDDDPIYEDILDVRYERGLVEIELA
jgi:hypothetical protein